MQTALVYRLALLLSVLVIVPAGYVVRFSPLQPDWIPDVLGSLAYEIFWVLLVLLVNPKLSPRGAAVGVFLATCGIEFLQLWHPPLLEMLRQTLPGRLVLGNTFLWWDFPPYAIGSSLGWLWAKRVKSLAQRGSAQL